MSRRRHARVSGAAPAAILAPGAGRMLAAAAVESRPILKASATLPNDPATSPPAGG